MRVARVRNEKSRLLPVVTAFPGVLSMFARGRPPRASMPKLATVASLSPDMTSICGHTASVELYCPTNAFCMSFEISVSVPEADVRSDSMVGALVLLTLSGSDVQPARAAAPNSVAGRNRRRIRLGWVGGWSAIPCRRRAMRVAGGAHIKTRWKGRT